jgi:hypothetical protein
VDKYSTTTGNNYSPHLNKKNKLLKGTIEGAPLHGQHN